MTTYESLSQRIFATKNLDQLAMREAQCSRHYENGSITAFELLRLDNLIAGKFIIFLDKLQTNTTITSP